MLIILRILTALVGLFMAYFVLSGGPFPAFVIADSVIAVGMLVASLLPVKLTYGAIHAVHCYAVGVFTVATATYFDMGKQPGIPLIILLAITALVSLILIFKKPVLPPIRAA